MGSTTYREANVDKVLEDYGKRDADMSAVVTRCLQERDEATGLTDGRKIPAREWFQPKGKRRRIAAADREQGLGASSDARAQARAERSWVAGQQAHLLNVSLVDESSGLPRCPAEADVQKAYERLAKAVPGAVATGETRRAAIKSAQTCVVVVESALRRALGANRRPFRGTEVFKKVIAEACGFATSTSAAQQLIFVSSELRKLPEHLQFGRWEKETDVQGLRRTLQRDEMVQPIDFADLAAVVTLAAAFGDWFPTCAERQKLAHVSIALDVGGKVTAVSGTLASGRQHDIPSSDCAAGFWAA